MSSQSPIIVIGASAGGFEALKTLIGGLSPDFATPIFIVWHVSADSPGVLPEVLNRYRNGSAAHARDHEPIEEGRIYIAPPDKHLLVENSHVRVSRGPKENRFRPAVDPLFRSAAYHYGPDAIGIVLSGVLDDGTSGLWTIKHRGGKAIVQHPYDAEVRSMPESAIRDVQVDHIVPVAEMPELLERLTSELKSRPKGIEMEFSEYEQKKTETELDIASEANALDKGVLELGELSPYTCPECHGVLSTIFDGNLRRFRCHTGHAFSPDSLLANLTENIENSLWSALRGIDESIIMLNHMGDHFAEANDVKLAALFFQKANESARRGNLIREALSAHEQLSFEVVKEQSKSLNATEDDLDHNDEKRQEQGVG